MGVTFIKRLENRSRSSITLFNKENSFTRGHGIPVPAGSSIETDMAVPWAPVQTDFPGHHLEIVVGGVTRYWIWQGANSDGDFIRFSTDGAWHDRGEHVHGYAGVATSFFEALAGFFNNQFDPLAQMFLGDRAVVVLDSHFESVPLASKPFGPPVTVVKQLENRSNSSVTVFSVESNETVTAAPGQTVPLSMNVPWAGGSGDFPGHHLRVVVGGIARFWIWQAFNQNDGDYVRFSTNGMWSPFATRVKGFAGTGENPADLVFTAHRSIIVSNTEFEVMPHPLLIDGLLDFAKGFIHPARRVDEFPMPTAPASVPKKSAVAFSMAGPVSDAFSRGQRDARFLYKESGKRYEFTLDADGKVTATHPDGTRTLLDKAFSFKRFRKGETISPPPFDLIAANGARVFAKAKGTDDFYSLTMDEQFVYKSKDAPEDAAESTIASSYFKIDPEFGQPTQNPADLLVTTNNIKTDHPLSERFPLFRRVLQRQPVDMMIAIIKPREWQQLDFRPPQNVAAHAIRDLVLQLAPLLVAVASQAVGLGPYMVFGRWAYFTFFKDKLAASLTEVAETASAPPDNTPIYRPVTYKREDGLMLSPPVIRYERVLDIGVGHSHFHQQYTRITGGEIQPMLLVDFYKAVYRFFNGPVRDGDGYIDGTCNFYVLVKHQPPPLDPNSPAPPPSYSLLFQDEQLYFSQRWRIVGYEDIKGTMFSLAGDLAGTKEYAWNQNTYWDPFKSGHIKDQSRLAVAAQVLLVTGKDPSNTWRIYSINFSWGSMDRTWRWRKLPVAPEGVVEFTDAEVAAGDEPIAPATRETVYPQTIRLRDDMTIHLKGTRNAGGQWTVGRWYQRYLPADNRLVPSAIQLVAGQMPSLPYDHKWKFLPERLFRLADNFYFFGVYDEVDLRCQYYDVTPATATDETKLQASAGPWIDDGRKLYVSQWKFRWHDPRLPGADPLDAPSLFNPDTPFRIVRKGSRWIALFWDKRDDDMMPFERLPRLVTLRRRTEIGTIESVQVTFGANHYRMDPPIVQNAYFWFEPNGVAGVAFESRMTSLTSLRDNVTRVRMASLEGDTVDPKRVARVNQFLDKVAEGNFFAVGPGFFEFRWTPSATEAPLLREHASPDGEMKFGTSIWFEDIVGNVAPPERIRWQRSATATGVATPAMIPLGMATQVTVNASDLRTGAPLSNGLVMVDGQEVGTTGVPFTFTFNSSVEQEWDPELRRLIRTGVINPVITVLVPEYPEAEVPVTYFTPEMQISVSPSPIWTGRPVDVIVRAVEKRTGALINGRVKLGGVDTAATNTPFSVNWGPRPPVGVVSAPGYADAGITWPIAISTMLTGITPFPVPFNRTIQATISATNEQTGAPVAGRVRVDGTDIGPTNTPITTIFRLRRVGIELELVAPTIQVRAFGYNDTFVETGF